VIVEKIQNDTVTALSDPVVKAKLERWHGGRWLNVGRTRHFA
jgi:hypothetical protein